MSPEFKRYLLGIGIGLIALVGLMVAAEVVPLAGLLVFPLLIGVVLWSEGAGIRLLGALALVVLSAFIATRVAG